MFANVKQPIGHAGLTVVTQLYVVQSRTYLVLLCSGQKLGIFSGQYFLINFPLTRPLPFKFTAKGKAYKHDADGNI